MKNAPFDVSVCGIRIPVKTGTEVDFADLEGVYACFDREKIEIWVHANSPDKGVPMWLAHEVLHAVLELSGALDVTSACFGVPRDDPKVEAWEEAFVRVLAPAMVESFVGVRAHVTSDPPLGDVVTYRGWLIGGVP